MIPTLDAGAPRPGEAERRSVSAEMAELRQDVLLHVILFCLALAFLALGATAVAPSMPYLVEVTVAALALIGLAGLAYWARPGGPLVAGGLLVAGLGALPIALLWRLPSPAVAPWLSTVVLLAAALLGRRATVAVAAALSAALIAVLGDGDARPWTAGSALLLLWATAALAWITSNPLRRALEWSWSSYLQAVETTGELREHQSQMGRVLKSLNETYERLEQTTRELERAREAAEQARRLKSQFAANISHELRTPLNLIIGFAQMMTSAPTTYGGVELPVAYRGDLEAIFRNARHLANLIDDVLDLSQIDAGRMGLHKEWAELAELVSEASRAVEALFVHRRLRLTVALPADLPPVYVDHARIRQVVVNLLANAAKFTDQGGATVSASRQGSDLVVTVADTGVGIAPEDLDKLFQEFHQLDQSTRRQGGSGLGLAISKHFVELHGGALWVDSTLGQGSCFSFSLPLHANVARESPARDWEAFLRQLPAGVERAPAVALLADDPGVVRLFQRHLEGYRITPLGDDGELAPDPAGEPLAAAVAVDAPGRPGIERLRALRGLPPGTPLIACSLPDREQARAQLGASDFLVKPVSPERLAAALARLGEGIRRVLVVDDDPDLVRLLAQMVRASAPSRSVLRAYNGEEALALARGRRPDAIVLDLSMPGTDGFALLRHLRATPELAAIPSIVVTAHGYELVDVGCQVTAVTRAGGMGISDLMAHLRETLGALAPSGHDQAVGADRSAAS
jgi:signal transduction histidine kinase/DNA-binding response OmpR family regulator